ncbi:MAG: hypothetical protein MJ123_00370 [Lachnospiraceae bacterium]|nr:hypothetical protein [Lachnospiraceae bacterium]
MRELLVVKAHIKKFVGKNDVFIEPILRFLLAYVALNQISSKIGFFTKLASKPVVLIVALAGSFLPINLTIVIMALMVLAHLYKLSLEVTLVVLAIFVVLFLLYFRFASNDTYAAILTPVSCFMGFPYVLPISMGLVGSPASMVTVACGVAFYNIIHFISVNAEALRTSSKSLSVDVFRTTIEGIVGNRDMMVLAVAFAATVLVVYIIRRLPVNYAWFIAIAAGAATLIVGVAGANSVLGGHVNVGSTFIGVILSVIINLVLQFFCFDLDYQRVEKVQFEDDEYYYYVKAVPKNDIQLKKKKAAVKPVASSASKPTAASRPMKAVPVKKAPSLEEETVFIEEDNEEIILTESEAVELIHSRPVTSNKGQAPVSRAEAVRRAQSERLAKERMNRNQ